MPNQLSIPFKVTSKIAIKSAVRQHIELNHTNTHPDEYKWDIARWEVNREAGVGGEVHLSSIDSALTYHAQLMFILTKLPIDINMPISFHPAFYPKNPAATFSNLNYERACVIFNLAALFAQLGSLENRATAEGIKRASGYFQSAAGTLSFLISSALKPFYSTIGDVPAPMDLTEPFLKSLEWLMLAQAQECFWQKAVMDNYRNGTVAKLSSQVATYYSSALDAIQSSSSSLHGAFPPEWIPHLQTKAFHFQAAAQFRKSLEDLEANRRASSSFLSYGDELARLTLADSLAKKGVESARRGVAKAVSEDIQSLADILRTNIGRAQRDNDLIYHQDVPAVSSLSAVQGAGMVQSTAPPGLKEPKTAIGSEDEVIFGSLMGWGVRSTVALYRDRKANWVQEEVVERAKELDSIASRTLQNLHLPSSLDAMEKPIGLPPSLLRKADEVRVEGGPERIRALLQDVEGLAAQDRRLLDESLDVLDAEAEEDESYRMAFAQDTWSRPASHEVNRELIDKSERYREVLDKALESDALVSKKWEEWEEQIVVLTWEERDLERAVPSTTFVAPPSSNSRPPSTAAAQHTLSLARNLRGLLESLDEIQRARGQLVQRALRLSEADDIQPRIMREASSFEKWVEVTPAMFEDTMEECIGKYDHFRVEIEEGGTDQEKILLEVQEKNSLFLQSRRDDPSVKERERSLQTLDLAYHKYREILSNLGEGLKFYNDFASILTQFRESCKTWVYHRREEVNWVNQAIEPELDPPGRPSPPLVEPQRPRSPPASSSPSPPPPPHGPDPGIGPGPLGRELPRPMTKRTTSVPFSPSPSAPSSPPPDELATTRRLPAVDDTPKPKATKRSSTKSVTGGGAGGVQHTFALDLPPPDSADWEDIRVPAHIGGGNHGGGGIGPEGMVMGGVYVPPVMQYPYGPAMPGHAYAGHVHARDLEPRRMNSGDSRSSKSKSRRKEKEDEPIMQTQTPTSSPTPQKTRVKGERALRSDSAKVLR